MTKTCSKCSQVKRLDQFYQDGSKPGGYASNCKQCKASYYRLKKQDRISYQLKYYERNKDSIIKYNANRNAKKYRNETRFRLMSSMRARLWLALKGKNKTSTTLDLIGCDTEELRRHLESQFTKGMNWNNYGINGWHVDHIEPCASFDLTDEDQQKKCFHYTNLQPLWAKDNLRKSNKPATSKKQQNLMAGKGED